MKSFNNAAVTDLKYKGACENSVRFLGLTFEDFKEGVTITMWIMKIMESNHIQNY